jgi:hypothetical protein
MNNFIAFDLLVGQKEDPKTATRFANPADFQGS